MKSEELLHIPMEELFVVLNDDMLNVKDEYLVWECILRWIAFDPDTRKFQLPKLLTSIRLGCLHASYFMDNIITHEYVVNNVETQPIILDVLNFLHDLHELGSHDRKVHFLC